MGIKLVLVHGWSYPYQGTRPGFSEARDDMKLDAMRTLEASAKTVRECAPDVRCHSIISEQPPAKAVIDAAREAGWHTVGVRRPGDAHFEAGVGHHLEVATFDALDLLICGPEREAPDLPRAQAGSLHPEQRHARLGEGGLGQVEDRERPALREEGAGLEQRYEPEHR